MNRKLTEKITAMGAKQQQGRAKLTPGDGRQGRRMSVGKLTAQDATQLTPGSGTRRYKPRARKCANKLCQQVFTPEAKHGRYCSDACRKVEARRKAKRGMKPTPTEHDLELTTCLYCGGTFLPVVGKGAKFCTDSHRVLASRKRRDATIHAISEATGMSLEDAGALVVSAGMANCTRWLRQQGMRYNDSLQRWLLAVGVDVYVDVGEGRRHGRGESG